MGILFFSSEWLHSCFWWILFIYKSHREFLESFPVFDDDQTATIWLSWEVLSEWGNILDYSGRFPSSWSYFTCTKLFFFLPFLLKFYTEFCQIYSILKELGRPHRENFRDQITWPKITWPGICRCIKLYFQRENGYLLSLPCCRVFLEFLPATMCKWNSF